MEQQPTAAIIIIGDEVLSGRTQDKNINFIAKELDTIGIRLMEVRIIPDIENVIITTLNNLRIRFNYIFTTGGIGPTHDDITTESIAKALNLELIQDPGAIAKLIEHYGKDQLNPARIKMATIPKGSIIIENELSMAPAYCIENIYVMAGIPTIMQSMFQAIKKELIGGKVILKSEITANISESAIADELSTIQSNFPEVTIGSYPTSENNIRKVSLVLRTTNKAKLVDAEKAVKEMLEKHA